MVHGVHQSPKVNNGAGASAQRRQKGHIIDEEHDASYKSQSSPRYHARQVAMKRASQLQAQIIRPCFSSGDVSTSGCRYPDPKTFSKGVFESAVPTLSPYQGWIEGIKAETDDYPWTGLGYTYDWNPENASHVGLSEFILPLGSSVDVEKVVSVQEFCESDLNDSSSPASSAQ
jgi:hypothetical protein